MKKIALFGGSGFIGMNFIQECGYKYEIIVFGRKTSHTISVNNTTYRYQQTEYKLEELEEILANFDVAINLSAAKVRSNLTFHDHMQSAYIANNIMQASINANCTKYIQISSRLLYKVDAPGPWNESSPEEPIGYYGLAKLLADKLLMIYNNREIADLISLRSAQIYGLIDGKIDSAQKNSLIMKCVENAETGLAQEIYKTAIGARDYLYVKDIIKAIDLAVGSEKVRGIFNIGSGAKYSPVDVAETVNKIYDNPSGIKLIPGGVLDSMVVELDISKAKKELNYSPDYSLSDGILDIKQIRGDLDESEQARQNFYNS